MSIEEDEKAELDRACDQLKREGQALIEIAECLRALPSRETASRVLRATAILHGIELPNPNTKGIRP